VYVCVPCERMTLNDALKKAACCSLRRDTGTQLTFMLLAMFDSRPGSPKVLQDHGVLRMYRVRPAPPIRQKLIYREYNFLLRWYFSLILTSIERSHPCGSNEPTFDEKTFRNPKI